MAIVDYNAVLGKRVKLTSYNSFYGSVLGYCVGFVVIAPNFERFSTSEILFLEDGFDEPDFVNFDRMELID